MTHTLIVGNVADSPAAVRAIAAKADYAMLNEARGGADAVVAQYAKTADWDAHIPTRGGADQNPHLWDTRKITVLNRGYKTLTRGGRIGLAGIKVSRLMARRWAKRRVGPNRAATWTRVEEVTTNALGKKVLTGKRGIYVDVHFAAGAGTFARWRLPIVKDGVQKLAALLAALEEKYPGEPIIVGGDGNLNERWPGMPARYVRMKTRPDMGGRIYTQIYVYKNGGDCSISDITEQHNTSDHDAPVATVDFGKAA